MNAWHPFEIAGALLKPLGLGAANLSQSRAHSSRTSIGPSPTEVASYFLWWKRRGMKRIWNHHLAWPWKIYLPYLLATISLEQSGNGSSNADVVQWMKCNIFGMVTNPNLCLLIFLLKLQRPLLRSLRTRWNKRCEWECGCEHVLEPWTKMREGWVCGPGSSSIAVVLGESFSSKIVTIHHLE